MKSKKVKVIGIYTAVFMLISSALFIWFRKYDTSFVQNWDAFDQYFPILTYLRKFYRGIFANIRDGNLSVTMFNMNFGYGFDVIQGLFYYGIADPLNFGVALVPENGIMEYYEMLIFLRLYLAGLFYILMCFYFGKIRIMTAITSFIYIFGGFAIYVGVVHPFFINAMMYLPLFIIGIDRIICKKSPVLFIVSVFMLACTGFYFSYMVTVIMAFYAVIRVVNFYWKKENFWKNIIGATLKGIVFYLLGLMMAMAIFLPGIIGYLNSTRTAELVEYNLLHYPWVEYRNYFVNMLSVEFDDDCLSISVVSIIAIITLAFRGKSKITLGLLITGIILYLCPLGAFIFNGFSTVTQRWIFALLLLIAYITLDGMDDIKNLSLKERITFGVFLLLYSINLVLFNGSTRVNKLSLIMVVIFAAVMLVVMNPKRNELLKKVVLALIIIGTVGANLVLVYAGKGLGMKNTFKLINVEDEITHHGMAAVSEENMTYRSEAGYWVNYNIGLAAGYSGIRTYVSMVPYSVSEYVCVMENASQTTNYSIYGLDYRSALLTLNSVKYIVTHSKKDDFVPYGYEYVGTEEFDYGKYDIYENKNFLPLGYTYDKLISKNDFDLMNALEKQDAMLQGVYVEELNNDKFASLEQENNLVKHNYSIVESNGVTISNGKIKTDYAGAYITLNFDKVKNSETYVCFDGLLVKDVELDIYVESEDDASRNVRVKPVVDRHYYGQCEYTVKVEYSEEGHDSVRIRFMYEGEFECSGIEVYSYEMDNFSKYTKNLSEDVLENISISQNTITGDIRVDEKKILCLAVPYMDGWTVKVDGVETPYYQANVMHIAIELEPGAHHVEYCYETPGLRTGVILSIVGFIGFAGVVILNNCRKVASIL